MHPTREVRPHKTGELTLTPSCGSPSPSPASTPPPAFSADRPHKNPQPTPTTSQSSLKLVYHRMRVCATSASDASTTPSSIRLVCSAMSFTLQRCQSNRSVSEHRRRSFLGLRCQLMINFRKRFTPEFRFWCRCVCETLIQTTCCLHVVFNPCLVLVVQASLDGLAPVNSGFSGVSQTHPSAKSTSYVPRTLRMCCHRPVPGCRTHDWSFLNLTSCPVSSHAATDNKFLCTSATVDFRENVFP